MVGSLAAAVSEAVGAVVALPVVGAVAAAAADWGRPPPFQQALPDQMVSTAVARPFAGVALVNLDLGTGQALQETGSAAAATSSALGR